MSHSHHWIIDDAQLGRCACGAVRQFEPMLETRSVYNTYMPPAQLRDLNARLHYAKALVREG